MVAAVASRFPAASSQGHTAQVFDCRILFSFLAHPESDSEQLPQAATPKASLLLAAAAGSDATVRRLDLGDGRAALRLSATALAQ